MSVLLHPIGGAVMPDYPGEDVSKHDIWWSPDVP